MWTVYILLCSNNAFYTGITNNLEKRFEAHKSGKGARYTKMYPPIKIVYFEQLKSKSEALKRELVIKKLSKEQKLLLSEIN